MKSGNLRFIIRPAETKNFPVLKNNDGSVHVRIGLLGKFTDVTIGWWVSSSHVHYEICNIKDGELWFQRGKSFPKEVTLEDAIRGYCTELSQAKYLDWYPKFEGWDE